MGMTSGGRVLSTRFERGSRGPARRIRPLVPTAMITSTGRSAARRRSARSATRAAQARSLRSDSAQRPRLRAAESGRSRGAVHVAGRALRAALGDGDQQPGIQPLGPDLPRPDGHRRGDRPPGAPLGGTRVRCAELSNGPVAAPVAATVTTASASWTATGSPAAAASPSRALLSRDGSRNQGPRKATPPPVESETLPSPLAPPSPPRNDGSRPYAVLQSSACYADLRL